MAILMHGYHNVLFSHSLSLEGRIADIQLNKPPAEQGLRLRIIQDVTALLPHSDAWTAYTETSKAYDDARTAYDDAWTAFDESFDGEAFHRAHCVPDCPWNGVSIFSGVRG